MINLEDFKLAAVIFDMDGLMLDTERVSRQAWQRAMADRDFMLSDELYASTIGRTAKSTRQYYLDVFGPALPIDEIFQLKQQYVDEIIANDGIATRPGLVELLDWLDQTSIQRALASSTVKALVHKKMTIAGVLSRFEVMVGGDEVQHGKPAPDIFLLAAQHLGVDPARCVVLEDSDAGIQAAHAAGMLPLMIPDLKLPSADSIRLAYRVFESLHEARAFLSGISN
jgi:HAD superfamily hydrolase (TIGR01509 family)